MPVPGAGRFVVPELKGLRGSRLRMFPFVSIQIETPVSGSANAAHMASMTNGSTATATTTSSLERYLAEISDPVLRENLAREIGGLKREFGLVFERHHPEGIRLPKHTVKRGSKVVISGAKDSVFYRVHRLNKDAGTATIVDSDGSQSEHPIASLTVAKEFGDVMYPGLRKLSEIRRGDPDAPVHTIINGENYHALEALQYTHAGNVDLIYIDPPYNTGAADWKYNDRYVDAKDGYRHSKWLSFMEKRLQIAKQLLKPTGILVMAIDDNEHHRLRMLADDVLGEGNFISNVVWNGGRKNDSRFLSNGADYMLVYARSREVLVERDSKWREDKPGVEEILQAGLAAREGALFEAYCQLVPDAREHFLSTHNPAFGEDTPEIREQWAATSVASGFHGVNGSAVRERTASIATAAFKSWWKSLPKDHPALASKHYNHVDAGGRVYFPADVSWPGGGGPRYDVLHPVTGKPVPIPSRGWVLQEPRMLEEIAAGKIHFGIDHERGINRKAFLEEINSQVAESVFYQDRRASAKHLATVLGDKRFPFPKDAAVLSRWIRLMSPKDAVILDFFGGSGTTAEAVVRLNAEDGGTRQAILVTNNELSKADDTKLRKAGHAPGDDEYEALGVFHHVTKPRLETVVTGIREDGSTYSTGLDANVAFFELTYLDEPDIVRGAAFNDLAGLFWLKAGGIGGTVELTAGAKADGFAISESGRTAVLFTPGRAQALAEKLAATEHTISHLFIVTDSEAQGDEAATHFPGGITVERIYGSYLEAFQVNRKD